MPEVVATTSVSCSLEAVWGCVGDMDLWGPMLKGYVRHEKRSDTESIWTLTGDLGPFSKEIRLNVRITDWSVQERVAFEMDAIGEEVTASGSLELGAEGPSLSRWQRFWCWLLGRQVSDGASHVTFRFAIDAGGPMGPMINPMLGPYADAVARELLDSVGSYLEGGVNE